MLYLSTVVAVKYFTNVYYKGCFFFFTLESFHNPFPLQLEYIFVISMIG